MNQCCLHSISDFLYCWLFSCVDKYCHTQQFHQTVQFLPWQFWQESQVSGYDASSVIAIKVGPQKFIFDNENNIEFFCCCQICIAIHIYVMNNAKKNMALIRKFQCQHIIYQCSIDQVAGRISWRPKKQTCTSKIKVNIKS